MNITVDTKTKTVCSKCGEVPKMVKSAPIKIRAKGYSVLTVCCGAILREVLK